MKVSSSVKTAVSLGLLLAAVGAGAVGVAHVLRQRQEVMPAPADAPTSSVTPPAVLPGGATAPGPATHVMPPQAFAMGEPMPGSNMATMSGFILAGSAASTTGMPDVQLLLDQMRDPSVRPDKALPMENRYAIGPSPMEDRYAVGPSWTEMISDKRLWTGHPVQDGRMYLGGSPGFDERVNGREFYA